MIQPWNLLVCIILGGPGVKTYTSCSHSCHFTATTCFEAFSTPISKPNVDAMVVTPLFSKQLPNSKAILTHKGPTWVSSGPSTNGAEDSSHTARLRTNFIVVGGLCPEPTGSLCQRCAALSAVGAGLCPGSGWPGSAGVPSALALSAIRPFLSLAIGPQSNFLLPREKPGSYWLADTWEDSIRHPIQSLSHHFYYLHTSAHFWRKWIDCKDH